MFYSYEGLRESGTFKLASATKTALSGNYRNVIGKAVTITGNCEVGYGSTGDAVLGIVEAVEPEKSGSGDYVVTVSWGKTFEDIACAGTESAGDFLVCNGQGGLKAAATEDGEPVTNCVALAVSTSDSTCIVKIV